MWNASPAQTEQKLLQEFYLVRTRRCPALCRGTRAARRGVLVPQCTDAAGSGIHVSGAPCAADEARAWHDEACAATLTRVLCSPWLACGRPCARPRSRHRAHTIDARRDRLRRRKQSMSARGWKRRRQRRGAATSPSNWCVRASADAVVGHCRPSTVSARHS